MRPRAPSPSPLPLAGASSRMPHAAPPPAADAARHASCAAALGAAERACGAARADDAARVACYDAHGVRLAPGAPGETRCHLAGTTQPFYVHVASRSASEVVYAEHLFGSPSRLGAPS